MMSENQNGGGGGGVLVGSLKKTFRSPHSGTDGDRVDAVATAGHEGSPASSASETVGPTGSANSTKGREVSRMNRFADYFVICGLDLDTGLEPDRFSGEYGGRRKTHSSSNSWSGCRRLHWS